MKTTSKVHGELMAARKAKRAAKGGEAVLEIVEVPATVQVEAAPTKKRTRASKGTEEPAAEASAPKAGAASKAVSETTDAAEDGAETCVFAFRLTRSERDLIHSVSGGGKATRFVKGVVLAAARGDVDGLLAIVTEAKAAKRG